MNGNQYHAILSGDEPKKSIKEDEFGLGAIVSAVADTLLSRVAVDGYVLGIQGPWGSGKSSLANFVAEEIFKKNPKHEIIRFDPWLIGEKTALLPFFLGQLSRRIDELERQELRWWQLHRWVYRWTRRNLASKVRKYGEYAATLAGSVGVLAGVR